MARPDLDAINWNIAENWRTLSKEMTNQIRPFERGYREAQGRLDKSARKFGADFDRASYNLGRLKYRLRYWKKTYAGTLRRSNDSAYKTESLRMVAAVTDPPIPSTGQYLTNPDILRVTFAQLQDNFRRLREASANMRRGLTTGVSQQSAEDLEKEIRRSPAGQAQERVTLPQAFAEGIPWGTIAALSLGYYILREFIVSRR